MVINKNKAFWLPAGSESFENPSEALEILPKSWKSSQNLENPPKILKIPKILIWACSRLLNSARGPQGSPKSPEISRRGKNRFKIVEPEKLRNGCRWTDCTGSIPTVQESMRLHQSPQPNDDFKLERPANPAGLRTAALQVQAPNPGF